MTQILNAKLLADELTGKADSASTNLSFNSDGIIDAIPTDNSLPVTDDSANIHDFKDKLITPAFTDSHMHILLFGSSLLKIDIENCRSLTEIQDTIRREALLRKDAPRLLCHGWMQASTNGLAFATDLDSLDPKHRPIYITAKDLHSAWLNTAAIAELNVQDTPDPEGGVIHRSANGTPSGLFSEAACVSLVWPYLTSITTFAENLSYIRTAITHYNAAGYTSVVEMATDATIWSLLTHLHTNEPTSFTLRVACYWLISPSKTLSESLSQVDEAIALHKTHNLHTSPSLRIAGIKLILDGVVDACTAAITSPYNHTTITGDMLWQPSHIAAVVSHADKAGLQVALHAIGDRAVNIAVNTLESHGTPCRRHRIEHLELTRPEDAARLGKLEITASIQPVHSDPAILRAWDNLLGKQRCARAFAYSEFESHQAKLAIGTDSPTAPHEPFQNLHVATTRKSARRDAGDEDALAPINEIKPLEVLSALRAATEGGAYSVFWEGLAGTLEVGKSADFIVVEKQTEKGEGGLMGYKVKETWFQGRQVWKDGG